jgi:beta-galactosidase
VTVDFAQTTGDLSAYRVVVVPSLFVASDEQLAALDAFAADGGTLVVGYLTGILDKNLHARTGGYLGVLQETLGVRVEEFAPPAAADLGASGGGEPPALRVRGDVVGGDGSASLWAEYVVAGSADVEAVFDGGVLDGHPAITRHVRGSGDAWYVATRLGEDSLGVLLEGVLTSAGVHRLPQFPGVELVRRGDVLVAINHSDETVTLDLPGTDLLTGVAASSLRLPTQGVALLRHP